MEQGARLRRNLTSEEVGDKIGVNRRVVSDAEKGKPSTTIAVYAALLWAYGLTEQLSQLADPETDQEGKALERARARDHDGKAHWMTISKDSPTDCFVYI